MADSILSGIILMLISPIKITFLIDDKSCKVTFNESVKLAVFRKEGGLYSANIAKSVPILTSNLLQSFMFGSCTVT